MATAYAQFADFYLHVIVPIHLICLTIDVFVLKSKLRD